MEEAAISTPSTALRRNLLLQSAGGLALFASFWFPPLVFVGLTPAVLLAASAVSTWRAGFCAWAGGLAFFLPGVQWLRYCDDSAWLGWLLLAFYLSLYMPVFVWTLRRLLAIGVPIAFATAIVWVALEHLRMHALTGFGWLLLAHSVYEWTPLLQAADFGGVYAVSFVVATINGLVAALLERRAETAWRARLRTPANLVALIVPIAALGYGWQRIRTSEFANGPSVVLVQTNLEQRLKLDNTDETYRAVEKVSSRANAEWADLLIWPETSFPYMFGDYPAGIDDARLYELYTRRHGPPLGRLREEPPRKFAAFLREAIDAGERNLTELCDRANKPLMVSVLRYDFKSAEPTFHNSAVLFAPGQGRIACYDKLHLVPFGEYVPLKDALPILKVLLPYDSDNMGVDPGRAFTILKHPKFHLAPTICFEDTLPHIGRGFMRARTATERVDFFVSQCNDGWFQGSVEGELHLAASVFRCIECRRAMVRSANMCVTAAIDPVGRVFAKLPKHAEEYLKVVVPLDRRETLYVQYGDWLPWLCWLAVFAGFASKAVNIVRRRRST